MYRPRRHERTPLVANLVIQPADEQSEKFACRMYNISKGGAAAFSEYCFPAGTLVSIEFVLPDERTGIRGVVLYGVIRRMMVHADGNMFGIEFVAGAGDYDWFAGYLDQHDLAHREAAAPKGFTLTEICITLVIVCLLFSMAAPIYSRAIEQARLDTAAGNLRTIWSAQRVYWLEYRSFTTDMVVLEQMDLLDSALVASQSSPTAVYIYVINDADGDSFTAKAMRSNSVVWTGQIDIDESGEVGGAVNGSGGTTLTPPQ